MSLTLADLLLFLTFHIQDDIYIYIIYIYCWSTNKKTEEIDLKLKLNQDFTKIYSTYIFYR